MLIRSATSVVLVGLIFVAIAAGLVLFVKNYTNDSPGVEILLPTDTPPAEIQVYISGAVASPGVYRLTDGDRLADAVELAGGATEDAVLSQVNLARQLKDEDHFHIPKVGEAEQNLNGTGEVNSLIDLNTASVSQLETLPGIGPVRAQAIVDYRETNGLFEAIEDVINVRGIGNATYESIRDVICAGCSR